MKCNFIILFGFLMVFEIRTCCTLVYTGHSAYGCFVAIAVPLNIPHQNVFVSYNFETAYGLPKEPEAFLPGGYQGFAIKEDYTKVDVLHEDSRKASESSKSFVHNNDSIRERKTKPLITKRAIYRMIQDKLKMSGFKGEACLLKLVCEINSSMVGRNNGVLGTILHILISPSSSAFEDLPNKLYKAESNGLIGDCSIYEQSCAYNLLDIFTFPIENLLNKHLSNK